MDKVSDMNVGEIVKRLRSDREEKFFVNTAVKVVSVYKDVKEGDKWSLGSVRAKDIEKPIYLRMNLWGKLSVLVNELSEGDLLKIKNGQAKNYSYGDRTYPQINCDDRYSTIEIRYKREKMLVDGSNVAWMSKKDGKPDIENIEIIRLELEKEEYNPIIIVDATLRHLVPEKDKERLEKWIEEEKVIQAPAQVRADDALLKFAEERGLKIVSNDTFKEYRDMHPWIEDKSRRVPFNIIGSKAILHFR
ncbi:MAG: hypothetical protein U9N35_08415 [Euryarchaeota archaeon]|nr:hypothetical protein [Euryarchaeota archaeon]